MADTSHELWLECNLGADWLAVHGVGVDEVNEASVQDRIGWSVSASF